MKQSEEVL